MANPLSKKQKAQLAQMARQAFTNLDRHGLIDVAGETTSQRFANWRHEQQSEACGQSSLRLCDQDDYLPLKAHFNSLLGRDDKALDALLKHGPENDHADSDDTPERRDRIIHLIEKELDGSRFHLGYAIAIAKNKFRKPYLKNLRILTVPQLKQVLYTVRNRVKQSA